MNEIINKIGGIMKEYGTFLVALIALLQPWVIALYKKFFKKGKIKIFYSGRIEIGYSRFGPTIGINGTLRCLNRDLFVKAMRLIVVKKKDDSKHIFDWAMFRSQKLTNKGETSEIELPYGFLLSTTFPHRYNILFIDMKRRDEMSNVLQKVRDHWKNLILNKQGISYNQENLLREYKVFSSSQIYVDAFSKIDRLCYWEAGSYELRLIIYTSQPDLVFEEKWRFELEEKEAEEIRLNSVKILQDSCNIPSSPFLLYNFAYVEYKDSD